MAYGNETHVNPDPLKLDQDVKVVLEKLQNWFNANKMILNHNKTYYMLFFS
jgi:hypothetical protein